jgi:hypothetical protein
MHPISKLANEMLASQTPSQPLWKIEMNMRA